MKTQLGNRPVVAARGVGAVLLLGSGGALASGLMLSSASADTFRDAPCRSALAQSPGAWTRAEISPKALQCLAGTGASFQTIPPPEQTAANESWSDPASVALGPVRTETVDWNAVVSDGKTLYASDGTSSSPTHMKALPAPEQARVDAERGWERELTAAHETDNLGNGLSVGGAIGLIAVIPATRWLRRNLRAHE